VAVKELTLGVPINPDIWVQTNDFTAPGAELVNHTITLERNESDQNGRGTGEASRA